MPSSSGWSSFFHVGAKTWRPKTADQSYLELERKKFAEEAERREAEVKQKIEMLDEVRKLEAKTQALNEMALSAEIQTKEHELAMRERQMAESKQIELAKLELAKRMGKESLNEADFVRIRRERMKAELLTQQSRDHALRELDRVGGQSEIDERMAAHMPQPPPFMSLGDTPMAGPIPMPGSMSTAGPMSIHNHMPMSGPMSMPSHMFMPEPMSMPGHMYMPPSGPQPNFDYHGGMPMGSQARLRGRAESFSAYPTDMGRGQWGPHINILPERGLRLSDHPDHQRMHFSSRDPGDYPDSMALQMSLRAQAELLCRKKLANLDVQARRNNWNLQIIRDLRKRDLTDKLRQRGLEQRQIEAEAAKLAERDRRLDEAQLRAERDREYRLMLKEKGLQEREITDQLRRREVQDRQILEKEMKRLECEAYHHDVMLAEREIREALKEGKPPPLGIARPSAETIKREGLLEDMFTEFGKLNPRLQQEIIDMEAHYRPNSGLRSRMPSVGSLNHHHPSRAPTPQSREQIIEEMEKQLRREDRSRASMRPGSKSSLREHGHDIISLSRHNSGHKGSSSPGPSRLGNRPQSRCLETDGPPLNLPRQDFETEGSVQTSGSGGSGNDASLAARLHSAALNSEINGGRRSRASSRASQMNDDFSLPRHRHNVDPSPLNPNVGRRSRASTVTELMESEVLRGGPPHGSSDHGCGYRSRSNSAAQSCGTSPQSRMMNERQINAALGRSPSGSNSDFVAREEFRTRDSRPSSRANMTGSSYTDNRYNGLTDEALSQIPTDALKSLLESHQVDRSMIPNASSNLKNIRPEDIEQMSPEQIEALFSQQPADLYADMSNLNVGERQSHPADGRLANVSRGGTSPSSSLLRQSPMDRGPISSSRSSSRAGMTGTHQSGLERRDSRNNSHSTSPLNPSNRSSPSNPKSLYTISGRHDMYEGQNDGARTSPQDGYHYQAKEDSGDDDSFVITEKPNQSGAKIIQVLGHVEASSRDNSNHSQPIDTDQAGLNDRDEMHKAVKNLIAKASREGANGVVCLRVNDLQDGSYVASGDAVILAHD
ncbi:hypothetical protein PtA15_11A160 [Puccinia triticina]|uniref:Uncharacterized protein n=1 Tax=Puccinia triticina TaxID=208348 RepID=A0ABY7CZD1_9BASI|nr:uncharacterized protein PtA15_11A160 [Puccinia triticina]WAQ89471.1 hypothetical protein PtA15_11A160 [Puccinia triticina]